MHSCDLVLSFCTHEVKLNGDIHQELDFETIPSSNLQKTPRQIANSTARLRRHQFQLLAIRALGRLHRGE
jgi:hypothetical protein